MMDIAKYGKMNVLEFFRKTLNATVKLSRTGFIVTAMKAMHSIGFSKGACQ